DPGKTDALLLTARQALPPIAVDIELIDQIREADRAQRPLERGLVVRRGETGIGEGVGERPERQIRPLRQKQPPAITDPNAAAAEWPQTRDGAQKRAFARPRRPGDQHRRARPRLQGNILAQQIAARQVKIELRDIDAMSPPLDCDRILAPPLGLDSAPAPPPPPRSPRPGRGNRRAG